MLGTTNYPEFNLYSQPKLIAEFGWEGLRKIMEQNAVSLRKCEFRPIKEVITRESSKIGLHFLIAATRRESLLVVPFVDGNGYRSVLFLVPPDDASGPVSDGQNRLVERWWRSSL